MKPLPEKFEESLRPRLGEEWPAFLASLQQPAPASVRIHPMKNVPELPFCDNVPWCASGRYLSTRPLFTLDPLYHGGTYYVQEASSMFLEQALKQHADLDKPLRVLDLCAAPGGKSTHLLSLLSRDSLLVSNEAIRSRASILSENIQKWGYPNTVVTNNDPGDFGRLTGYFDALVVDAPCSGEGLFRKDEGAMEEWSPENVQLCSSRQRRIVGQAWEALRKDGLLLYCTCTYNESENEANLQWLKENHRVEFLRVSIDPSWGIEEVITNGVVAYRFFPHRSRGEGFFLSVIKKTGPTTRFALKSKTSRFAVPGKVRERLQDWIINSSTSTLFQFQDLIFLTPDINRPEIEFLLTHLKIVYAGTNVARLKHDKLIPEHSLALSIDVNKDHFTTIDLAETEALKYLRKDTIEVASQPRGYALITCRRTPIGWANILPSRVNNLYPSEWRIRMSKQ